MLAISRRAAGELRRDIDSQYNGKPHHLSPPEHALATKSLLAEGTMGALLTSIAEAALPGVSYRL